MKLINIFRRSKYKNFLKRLTARLVGSYKVDIKDKHFFVKYSSFWENVNNGNWEPSTFYIFDKFIDKEHSFIDIGAWIGPTTLYGSQIAKKCYAIEPDPVAFYELKKNINLNPNLKSRINIYELCISDKCGKIRLGNRNNFGDSMSSILLNDLNKTLFVQSLTLQEFILQNKIDDCNFIKIDIEGGEAIVLPQIKEFLEKNKPTIHLSLHPSLFKDIESYSKLITKTLKIYENIFDHEGESLTANNALLNFLLKPQKGADIVATDRSWNN